MGSVEDTEVVKMLSGEQKKTMKDIWRISMEEDIETTGVNMYMQ